MGIMTSFLASGIAVPDLNWVGKIIEGLYGAIGNYGWTVVLFTVILKVITLPLDFWQRCSAKKNAKKMEQMKPMLAKIDKAYGENKKGAQAEKQKLMKKFGYSMFSSCLPMIVTLVIFVIMFSGLTSYTTHANVQQYNELVNSYHYAIIVSADENGIEVPENLRFALDGKYKSGTWTEENETALSAFKNQIIEGVKTGEISDEKYNAILEGAKPYVDEFAYENRESFLWIKNIWRPDTWESVMPSYNDFINGTIGVAGISEADKVKVDSGEYQIIYDAVAKGELSGGYAGEAWNGLLILPILSALLSFLSMKISQKTTQATMDPSMQGGGKMMSIMMPLIMVVFVLMYTAALGVYFVCNSLLTIIISLALTPIINKMYSKKDVNIVNKASYRR